MESKQEKIEAEQVSVGRAARRAAAGKKPASAPQKKAAPGGKPASGAAGRKPAAGKKAAPGAAGRKSARKEAPKGILYSTFYRVYFAVVLVAAVAIFFGLRWLSGLAAEYEASQPKHVAEDVAQLFENGDFNAIYQSDTTAQSIAEGDQSFYIESLTELTAGKDIRWNEAFSTDENERVYSVKLDGSKFASFTLVPSGETTAHGNRLWKLGSITTNLVLEKEVNASLKPYRVKAPSGSTVTIDGTPLTEADVVTPRIEVLPENFLPDDVEAPTLVEYGFSSESSAPAIVVKDASGVELPVEADGESKWICRVPQNTDIRDRFGDTIVKMAQNMAKYTTKDLSQDSMLSSVASDSPAEQVVKKFSNYWAPTHRSVSFKNGQVTDVYMLSDSCITCHVKFDYILTSVRDNDYVYQTDYTLCIVKRSKGAKLYNIVFY